jgi:hypothetical protein
VDLEDQLEVEGDEAPDQFRSRFLAQLAAELQEVEAAGDKSSRTRGSSSSSSSGSSQRGGRGSGGSSSSGGRGARGGKSVRLRGSAKRAVAELQALFEGEQPAPAVQQQKPQQQRAEGTGKAKRQESART